VLPFSLDRCVQEFDGNIKEEITDETDHNNDSQLLPTRYEYSLLS